MVKQSARKASRQKQSDFNEWCKRRQVIASAIDTHGILDLDAVRWLKRAGLTWEVTKDGQKRLQQLSDAVDEICDAGHDGHSCLVHLAKGVDTIQLLDRHGYYVNDMLPGAAVGMHFPNITHVTHELVEIPASYDSVMRRRDLSLHANENAPVVQFEGLDVKPQGYHYEVRNRMDGFRQRYAQSKNSDVMAVMQVGGDEKMTLYKISLLLLQMVQFRRVFARIDNDPSWGTSKNIAEAVRELLRNPSWRDDPGMIQALARMCELLHQLNFSTTPVRADQREFADLFEELLTIKDVVMEIPAFAKDKQVSEVTDYVMIHRAAAANSAHMCTSRLSHCCPLYNQPCRHTLRFESVSTLTGKLVTNNTLLFKGIVEQVIEAYMTTLDIVHHRCIVHTARLDACARYCHDVIAKMRMYNALQFTLHGLYVVGTTEEVFANEPVFYLETVDQLLAALSGSAEAWNMCLDAVRKERAQETLAQDDKDEVDPLPHPRVEEWPTVRYIGPDGLWYTSSNRTLEDYALMASGGKRMAQFIDRLPARLRNNVIRTLHDRSRLGLPIDTMFDLCERPTLTEPVAWINLVHLYHIREAWVDEHDDGPAQDNILQWTDAHIKARATQHLFADKSVLAKKLEYTLKEAIRDPVNVHTCRYPLGGAIVSAMSRLAADLGYNVKEWSIGIENWMELFYNSNEVPNTSSLFLVEYSTVERFWADHVSPENAIYV